MEKASVLIDGFFAGALPPEEVSRIRPHYDGQLARLQGDLTEAIELDHGWERASNLRYGTDELSASPGEGPFFLTERGSSSHEALDATGLALRLALGSASPDHLVWRKGMVSDWSPVKDSPLAHLLMASEVPSALPNTASSPGPSSTVLPSLVHASPLAQAPIDRSKAQPLGSRPR